MLETMSDSESTAPVNSESKPLSLHRRLVFTAVTFLIFVLILLTVEVVTRLVMEPVSSFELFIVSPQQEVGFSDKG